MKFVVMRFRTVKTREFYEVEGEDYRQAVFEQPLENQKHIKTIVVQDSMTVSGPTQEADKVNDEWFEWASRCKV